VSCRICESYQRQNESVWLYAKGQAQRDIQDSTRRFRETLMKRFLIYFFVGLLAIVALEVWAIPPTPEVLKQSGGVKCKFFDNDLVLIEEKIFYWNQLIDIENRKMVFKTDDGVYTIQDGDPNPWICIPI